MPLTVHNASGESPRTAYNNCRTCGNAPPQKHAAYLTLSSSSTLALYPFALSLDLYQVGQSSLEDHMDDDTSPHLFASHVLNAVLCCW